MSETNADWLNERGRVTKRGEVPLLDPAQEYVLSLEEMDMKRDVKKVFKGKEKTIDEFRTVWKVEGKDVKVWQSFNRSWNKKSTLVAFVERLYGIVLKEEEEHSLGEFFTPKMRIRCHLELQEGGDAESRFYNIALNTLRKYNADPQAAPTPAPASAAPATPPKPAPATDPEVERIYEFLKVGRFVKREEAQDTVMKVLGIDDGSRFAAAWGKYQKAPIIVA